MTVMVRYLPKRSPTGPIQLLIGPVGDRFGTEIGGDLRQQRVGHPHHGLARKSRHREQDDGARGDFLGCYRTAHADF